MDKTSAVKVCQDFCSRQANRFAVCALLIGTTLGTASLPAQAQSPDLATSSDMVESSLSMSLNARAIAVDNETVFISVSQFGLNNVTNIIQSGNASNLSQVVQAGSNNGANIMQFGEGNVVNLVQQNDNNYFEIVQDGFDNVANVNQLGEQAFTVYQIGNEMVVNITQYQQ
jgi:minor curlin subunit